MVSRPTPLVDEETLPQTLRREHRTMRMPVDFHDHPPQRAGGSETRIER